MGISNKYGKYDSLQCKHYNPCSISCSRKRILRMDNTKQTLLDLTSFSMDYIYIYNCKWSKTTLTHDVALCVTEKRYKLSPPHLKAHCYSELTRNTETVRTSLRFYQSYWGRDRNDEQESVGYYTKVWVLTIRAESPSRASEQSIKVRGKYKQLLWFNSMRKLAQCFTWVNYRTAYRIFYFMATNVLFNLTSITYRPQYFLNC